MSKIIIYNHTTLSMGQAMRYVNEVIEMGRISDDGKAYCFHTSWENGPHITATSNKRSDTFIVSGRIYTDE